MGHVFDFADATAYGHWTRDPRNQIVIARQNHLMMAMLKPERGASILDVGCGNGLRCRPLMEAGLNVSGLDPSPYMLDLARRALGQRVDLHRGCAEDLPFDDNSFTYVAMVVTLEFVDDPRKAIEEACRVAKDRVFLGVHNRYAPLTVGLRLEGVFRHTIFNRARFFSIWQLKKIIRELTGNAPIVWRTSCHLPNRDHRFGGREKTPATLIQKIPFGAFIGIMVTLLPRFRTRPLELRYRTKRTTGVVPG